MGELRTQRRAEPIRACRWLVPVVVAVVWASIGSTFLGFRVAVADLPPFLLTAGKLLLGALVVGAVVAVTARTRRRPRPTRAQLEHAAVMALLLLVVGQGALVWGLQQLQAGVAAVLTSSVPMFVALLARWWLHRRLGRTALAGIVVGFVGLLLLTVLRDGGAGGSADAVPVAVTIAGSVASAAGLLYGSRADLPVDPMVSGAVQLLVAGVVLTTAGLMLGEAGRLDLDAVPAGAWWALVFLAAVGAASTLGLVWLAAHSSPPVASSFAYASPVIALGLSAWLLGEALGPATLAAAGCALVGVVLMIRSSPAAGG